VVVLLEFLAVAVLVEIQFFLLLLLMAEEVEAQAHRLLRPGQTVVLAVEELGMQHLVKEIRQQPHHRKVIKGGMGLTIPQLGLAAAVVEVPEREAEMLPQLDKMEG